MESSNMSISFEGSACATNTLSEKAPSRNTYTGTETIERVTRRTGYEGWSNLNLLLPAQTHRQEYVSPDDDDDDDWMVGYKGLSP